MRSIILLALLGVLFVSSVSAGLYSPSDNVVELTASNFNDKVIKSDGVWLVEFYAPWCGHCKSLAPEWVKAAQALNGIVHVGGVDMDVHQSVGAPYDVKGFPTIKLFGLDKKNPLTYSGQRSAADIVRYAMDEARKVATDRLSGKKGSGGGSSSGSKSSGSGSSSGGGGGGNGKVITLTSSNFEQEVLNSDDLYLVEFYAPWCGHCKNLEPEWKRAAGQLGGIAKLGALDATVYQDLAQKYGIKGYPTIKVFKPGQKQSPIDYESGRTADAIVQYTKNMAEANAKPKEVVQLIDESTFQEHCVDQSSLCLISFFPHILDSGAKGRNAYITVLNELAKKYKSRPFSYVWAEAGSQLKLEEQLNVGGSGYPAVAVLNVKKSRYAVNVGAFSVESIGDFLKNLLSGREKTIPFDGTAVVVKTPKWDGKDGEKPVETNTDDEL